MLSLKCRKHTKSKNPEVVRTKKRRIIVLSNFSGCSSKNSKFRKEQEARELFSNLPGLQILLLSDLRLLNMFYSKSIIMNALVNKLLLTGD